MTPTARLVFDVIVTERREAAAQGGRVTAEDVAIRWMANHKIRALLPADPTLCDWLRLYVMQLARKRLADLKDAKGNRIILSPLAIGHPTDPRGYVGREAMTVGEHVDLGRQQIRTGKKKLTEGASRVAVTTQAVARGRRMSEPLGELAAEVTFKEEA